MGLSQTEHSIGTNNRDAAGAMLQGVRAFLLCMTFVLISGPACGLVLALDVPATSKSGPFVDKVEYKVTTGGEQEALALLNNQVDLIGETVDPQFLPQLMEAENINVANVPRNGYGYLTIKTDKYPYNITNFRRALAFAVDKNAISDEVWAGLSEPQDSCVPKVNPFSVEGHMPYNYYSANIPLANELLDESGFIDENMDGWREAPNGLPFGTDYSGYIQVKVECASSSTIAVDCGSRVAAALAALHVRAVSVPTDFYESLNRLYFHSDYDIVFLSASFSTFDVNWLAHDFSSINYHTPYYNFPCWRNQTYDSWIDQLQHSTKYVEVYQAAEEMQKIWIHACPEIILYENLYLSAYRNDKFEGFVNSDNANSLTFGPDYFWTNYRVHLKPSLTGPFGGTLRWSESLDLDTFSPLQIHSCYCQYFDTMLYSSLFVMNTDGLDIPWLAESCRIETHDDNATVPAGHTRLTFGVVQNATWTDGIPLTADDVAYTFNFLRDALGNQFEHAVRDMVTAYATTAYQVMVEFSNESYWYFHSIAHVPIIPKHVFILIGPDNWNMYNPRPPEDNMVTSGPFNVSAYVQGDMLEFSRNPEYFYGFSDTVRKTTTPTTTSGELSNLVGALIVGGSMSTIVIFCSLIALRKRSKPHLLDTTVVNVGTEPWLQVKNKTSA